MRQKRGQPQRIDENDLFRQATLRICRHLAIEEAMCSCAAYLQPYIPVDRMFLQLYEPELTSMRILAAATASEGTRLDILTPLPEPARAVIRKGVAAPPAEQVMIVNDPKDNPVARVMLDVHGLADASVLRMTLVTDHGRLGGVVLTADGLGRYEPHHARLLSLLREPFAIAMANALEHREVEKLRDLLADDNRYLQGELDRKTGAKIIGAHGGLRTVVEQVRLVAPTESSVVILGETGVGKDLIASAIHRGSRRSEGPFISVNCGAIPESLIDSELFGHEKGAFSGAVSQHRGRFERAQGGTLFLDEVAELPASAQVRLLRVLQNRELERVGGVAPIPLNIRVVSATNRDVPELIRNGSFREDLWFRLNAFPIFVPPLRERRDDMPALVQHLRDRKARELKLTERPRLKEGAMDQLMSYSWPGNVRELENVIERAMILRSGGGQLDFRDLLDAPAHQAPPPPKTKAPKTLPSLDAAMAAHIGLALELAGGKVYGPGGAAELLGVNPNTLRYKMRRLGVPFGKAAKISLRST